MSHAKQVVVEVFSVYLNVSSVFLSETLLCTFTHLKRVLINGLEMRQVDLLPQDSSIYPRPRASGFIAVGLGLSFSDVKPQKLYLGFVLPIPIHTSSH